MEPWHTDPPPSGRDTEEYRRYQRALRLSLFARELAAWAERGLLDSPHYAKRAGYRQMCLTRWQDYLDGRIAPPEGRKPKEDRDAD